LEAALRDMRHTTLPARIWADALCINQLDNNEKSHQVSLMGNIYSTATHTIIHIPSSNPRIYELLDAALRGLDVAKPEEQQSPELKLLIHDFLASPWFSRAWVFQELVLSRDPWIQSGPFRARWDSVCRIVGLDRISEAMKLNAPAETQAGDKKTASRKPLSRLTGTPTERLAMPLHRMFATRRGIQATDPRDIVYANLGIISDPGLCNTHIRADYSKTVTEVFLDSALYFFHATSVGVLLKQATMIPKDPALGLPSWIPDWTQQRPGQHEVETALYESWEPGSYRIIQNPPLLCFTGHVIGEVDEIERPNASQRYITSHKRAERPDAMEIRLTLRGYGGEPFYELLSCGDIQAGDVIVEVHDGLEFPVLRPIPWGADQELEARLRREFELTNKREPAYLKPMFQRPLETSVGHFHIVGVINYDGELLECPIELVYAASRPQWPGEQDHIFILH